MRNFHACVYIANTGPQIERGILPAPPCTRRMRLPRASGPRAQQWPFLPVAYCRPGGRCSSDSRTRRWLYGPACYSCIIHSSRQATPETAHSGLANTCTRSCFTSGTPDSSLHTTGNTRTHPSIGSRLLEHHTQKNHCTTQKEPLTSPEATASSMLRKARFRCSKFNRTSKPPAHFRKSDISRQRLEGSFASYKQAEVGPCNLYRLPRQVYGPATA